MMNPGWQNIEVGDVMSFQVPEEARPQNVQPIDSLVGIIDGPGFQITYDYGRFAEKIEEYRDHPGYSETSRRGGFGRAREASFEDPEGTPEHPFVRLLRIDREGDHALTMRVSCKDAETCDVAEKIFASISFK